jgi:flagellar biosynthesis protein FlhF
MKIIRHTARDMRQALRAVREQLGEDAVILNSRRTDAGVEVTAAVDFDAQTLEAGGFADAPGIAALPASAPAKSTAAPDNTNAVATRSATAARADEGSRNATPDLSYDALAGMERLPFNADDDSGWISEAAREAVAAHAAEPRAPVLVPAAAGTRPNAVDPSDRTGLGAAAGADPVEEVREATLTPLSSSDVRETFAQLEAPTASAAAVSDAMGEELKTLRRMLETQLAHLAWNDLTRRAPVHSEILRELTEIGITQDLAEHLVRQLPEDTDLTFARRFSIAGLSQYVKVTGDQWLDEGGRVAFAGATGVGKTTTLAKIAVRWVLRHGPRDIALVAADSVRIGAQDQLRSLAQLLGVPVYTPERFDDLPTLLARLHERLVLIDTPGASVRDPQLAGRLAVLSNSASSLQTALVLAASTQAGAIEEAVKHFAPANPACCVLTKLDEAASLGGVLSVLIRARLPVSYMSEGQRVPEDLRPARALELVSTAVRLAKARGAAADEDLLRRRFGKTAHGIS